MPKIRFDQYENDSHTEKERKLTTTYPNELALFWAIYDRIL